MPETAAAHAKVYFTHDISPEGLVNAYKALGRPLEGRKVAVKISTGEAGNDHYLKPALIGPLVQSLQGDIVECNTAYAGKRMKTSDHRKVIADHGFNDIAKVVILDEFADAELPTPAWRSSSARTFSTTPRSSATAPSPTSSSPSTATSPHPPSVWTDPSP
ncbi:MAG: DUF362 domain-containing protein [Kiritimatiellae bacterium]|nr:DUF362 domain-containing protein [Kiritimatiellia bacterium]